MIVSMDKNYTIGVEPFTLLTVTKPGLYPVLGYLKNGAAYEFSADGLNFFHRLVEVSPYADFVIDEPVMVRDADDHQWRKAHFSGVVDSHPSAFFGGLTKWSSNGQAASWLQCRRPTKEELAK